MDIKLLADLLKSNDNLQTLEFSIYGEDFKIYYKYLTLLEKVRVEQMAVKRLETIHPDGSKTVKFEKQDHLIPIHIILEKSLDENGKRIYSHTTSDDFNLISSLPAGVASEIACVMAMDIMGNLEKEKEEDAK